MNLFYRALSFASTIRVYLIIGSILTVVGGGLYMSYKFYQMGRTATLMEIQEKQNKQKKKEEKKIRKQLDANERFTERAIRNSKEVQVEIDRIHKRMNELVGSDESIKKLTDEERKLKIKEAILKEERAKAFLKSLEATR